MGLKCAIFEICPKLAQKDTYMKQMPSTPFLGIVSDKKWSLSLDLGVRNPIFLHPKTLKIAVFGERKWDFRCPDPKTEANFCRKLSLKMVQSLKLRV